MDVKSNRRNFLKTAGLAVGGLVVAGPLVSRAAALGGRSIAQETPPPAFPTTNPTNPNPQTNPATNPSSGALVPPNTANQGFYGSNYPGYYGSANYPGAFYGTGYYGFSYFSGYYGGGDYY